MKKFGKLAWALLMAASLVAMAAGCSDGTIHHSSTQQQEVSVLYKSTGGDIISGTRFTGGTSPDYLVVTITIRDPSNAQQTIATGINRTVTISGSSIFDVDIDQIKLRSGTISGTEIQYTVSGTYGSSNTQYQSKTITFTKQ